jgi:hypothetical protein
MADRSISGLFRQDLKQCLICGDYNIDMRRRFKNALNCWFCSSCYIGQNKVKCRDCKTPIEITKDYSGNFKNRCWMCYLGRIRTNTTII